MKVTTARRDLLELLGKLQAVANSRHLLPILSHYLIETDNNGKEVKATASNLEVFLSGKCKAKVAEKGAILMPLSVMDFLKASKAEQVTLYGIRTGKKVRVYEPPKEGEAENPKYRMAYSWSVKVEANGVTNTLPSENPKDFPPVRIASGKKVGIANLVNSLRQVSHAMATEDTRPLLACVCFTSKKGSVELAAADGFRLAVTNASAKGKLAEQVLIPLRIIKLIEKLCPGKVTMQVSPKPKSPESQWATFESNGLVLTALVTQGTFPNYAQLIPKKGHYLAVATKDIQEAVMMAGVTANKGSGVIRLQTGKKGLLVSGRSENEVTDSLVLPVQGKIKAAFHYKYLMDILNRVGEKFTIRTTTPSAPGVVKANGTTHVVMPMTVQW